LVRKPVGAWLAREYGVSVDINVAETPPSRASHAPTAPYLTPMEQLAG